MAPDEDEEDLDRLTAQLRTELLDLDVESVRLGSGGKVPPRAKAGSLVHAGELVVVLGVQRHLVRAVVDVARGWLARQEGRSLIFGDGENRLELHGASEAQVDQIVEAWVKRDNRSD